MKRLSLDDVNIAAETDDETLLQLSAALDKLAEESTKQSSTCEAAILHWTHAERRSAKPRNFTSHRQTTMGVRPVLVVVRVDGRIERICY